MKRMRIERWLLGLALAMAAAAGTAQAETSYSSVETGPTAIVDFGFGLPVYSNEYSQRFGSGTIGWSLNGDILSQLGSSQFLWGMDFAANFYGFNNTPSPVAGAQYTHSAIGIAPLITLMYRFRPVPGTELIPRLGIATGPSIYIQRNRYTNPNTNQADSNSDTSIRWETVARPGVEWQMANAFSIAFETELGLVGSDFIFQPELRFSLLL